MNKKEPCPVYRKCGGCQLQNMDYPRQLSFKQNRCQKLLHEFGTVSPIIGMENPYHYRNKVQTAFQRNRSGRMISGIYQSSTDRVVEVKQCQTEDLASQKVIKTVAQLLKDFKLTVYDAKSRRGFIRHVLLRRGFMTGELMVVLVTGTPVFTAKKHFTAALLKAHPEITTIVQNIYQGGLPMILGSQEKLLYGPGYITDLLCGCRFRISARSFYQINPRQTALLYQTAMRLAELTPADRVLDAYCGIGTIGIVAAKQAGHVIGVESNHDAIKDAIVNARENKLKNTWFQAGDAGECITQMAKAREPIDLLFLDPPRQGASSEFLSSLLQLAPARAVYISCNPESLQRDLRQLTGRGRYTVKAMQPVDMFPFTNHVETVVLLTKRDS